MSEEAMKRRLELAAQRIAEGIFDGHLHPRDRNGKWRRSGFAHADAPHPERKNILGAEGSYVAGHVEPSSTKPGRFHAVIYPRGASTPESPDDSGTIGPEIHAGQAHGKTQDEAVRKAYDASDAASRNVRPARNPKFDEASKGLMKGQRDSAGRLPSDPKWQGKPGGVGGDEDHPLKIARRAGRSMNDAPNGTFGDSPASRALLATHGAATHEIQAGGSPERKRAEERMKSGRDASGYPHFYAAQMANGSGKLHEHIAALTPGERASTRSETQATAADPYRREIIAALDKHQKGYKPGGKS